jgi:hypothetical protein
MYNLTEMMGKVVTIKSHKGDEIVTKLMGVNDEGTILTVFYPKLVVIADDSVVLIPFALTALTSEVYLHVNQIFAVMPTLETTAEEYLDLIEEEAAAIKEELEEDDEDEDEDEDD